uniref:Uncharacterized protein n=1 Tax=Opuntia streptacantha TaxID=393608 RepID=A0A7C9CR07_OPUST
MKQIIEDIAPYHSIPSPNTFTHYAIEISFCMVHFTALAIHVNYSCFNHNIHAKPKLNNLAMNLLPLFRIAFKGTSTKSTNYAKPIWDHPRNLHTAKVHECITSITSRNICTNHRIPGNQVSDHHFFKQLFCTVDKTQLGIHSNQ